MDGDVGSCPYGEKASEIKMLVSIGMAPVRMLLVVASGNAFRMEATDNIDVLNPGPLHMAAVASGLAAGIAAGWRVDFPMKRGTVATL